MADVFFHSGIKIQDQALIAAAVLSNRYITDRFLPDKAIDLVDEACALIRTEMDSMPTELDEIRRKILIKSRCTDTVQLAPCKHRFQQVACVHCAV